MWYVTIGDGAIAKVVRICKNYERTILSYRGNALCVDLGAAMRFGGRVRAYAVRNIYIYRERERKRRCLCVNFFAHGPSLTCLLLTFSSNVFPDIILRNLPSSFAFTVFFIRQLAVPFSMGTRCVIIARGFNRTTPKIKILPSMRASSFTSTGLFFSFNSIAEVSDEDVDDILSI